MGALQTGQFRFGDFLLDVSEHTLFRGGDPRYLPPRTFDTLVALVSRPGQLVTKDELIQTIWEGGVVTDNALTRCIKEVRSALDDDARSPSFIETVPRIGYRFIAEVESSEDSRAAAPLAEESEPGNEHTTPVSSGPGRRSYSGALLALAVILLIWVLLKPSGEQEGWSGLQDVQAMQNTVAVLPFTNFTDNADLEYYGDGVAEEVTNHLSLAEGLSVLAFNVSSLYRGSATDPRKVARELGVQYVISGSLRQAGNTLRVSTTLVEAETGVQLWSMAEETTVLEAWSVQEGITQGVATAMRSELDLDWGRAPELGKRAPDPEAYDLYLRGRSIWSRRGVEDMRVAVDMLGEAVRVDPDFARGWSALASAYIVWPSYSPEGFRTWHLAQDAAKKALELDNSLAEPRAVLTSFEHQERDWVEANRLFEEALEIEPRNATINYWFSEHLAKTGRYTESMAWLARTRILDPTYPPTLTDSVFALANYGRTDDAVRVFEHAWNSGLRNPTVYVAGFIANTLAGDFERARALAGEMPVPNGNREIMLAFVDVEAGKLDAQAWTKQLEGDRDSWPHYVIFVWMASRLGATDLAFEALDQRVTDGGSIETRMLWGPRHRLIEHQEFARFAGSIGLVEYWEAVSPSDFCNGSRSGFNCSPPQPGTAPESLNALLKTLDF